MRKLIYNPENCTQGSAVSKGAAPTAWFSFSSPPSAAERIDCKGIASNQFGRLAGALIALAMLLMPVLGWTQTMTSISFDPTLPNAGNGCNAPAAVVNIVMAPTIAGNGLEYRFQYDVTGANIPVVGSATPGVFSPPAALNNIPAGPHCMWAVTRTTANNVTYNNVLYPTAGTVVAIDTDCFYIGTDGPPGPIDISGFNLSCATTIAPPATPALPSCWVYEYEIDLSGVWTSTLPIAVQPGCHTIRRRAACTSPAAGGGPFGCGAPGAFPASPSVNFAIFNDLSTVADANLLIRTTCATYAPGFPGGGVAAVVGLPAAPAGLTYEYAVAGVNGGAFGTLAAIGPLAAGCYSMTIRQSAACPGPVTGTSGAPCQKTLSFAVFPAAPITGPVVAENGSCATPPVTLTVTPASLGYLTLPAGFGYQFSVNGGAFSAAPTAPVGCNNVVAKIVRTTDCGNSLIGEDSDDSPNDVMGSGCPPNSAATTFTIHPSLTGYTNTLTPASSCVVGAATTTVSFSPALPALPAGLQYVYALDVNGNPGNTFSTTIPAVGVGCHTITVSTICTATAGAGPFAQNSPALSNVSCRYTTSVLVFPDLAGETVNSVILDVACGPTTVANVTTSLTIIQRAALVALGFQLVYQLDGAGAWVAFPPAIGTLLQPGCHTIRVKWEFVGNNAVCADAQAPDACATPAFNFAVFPDLSGIAPASVTINTTCDNPLVAGGQGSATVVAATLPALPTNWSYEYAFDNGPWVSSNTVGSLAAGCHSVRIRQVSNCGGVVETMAIACRLNITFVVFPDASVLNITTVTKSATCGTTDITAVNWDAGQPPAVAGFTVQYSLDGGTYQTAATFNGVAPGCHTIDAKYNYTGAACTEGASINPPFLPIPASQFNDVRTAPDACREPHQFIVWADLSAATPVVTLNQTCGNTVNISSVALNPAVSIPAGQVAVYYYTVSGGAVVGPVSLAALQAVNFDPNAGANAGCHSISVGLQANSNCADQCPGADADGACSNDASPIGCRSTTADFLTFPAAPTMTVAPVCNGGDIVAVPTPTNPLSANYAWRFRLVNTATNVVTTNWQASSTFVNPAAGCYRVEAVPVRTTDCGLILVANGNGGTVIYPSNIQNPLNAQTAAIVNALPASFPAACVSSIDAFVLPQMTMAITPNNITVCFDETGRIDLQAFTATSAFPACLIDPAGAATTQIQYAVSSSDATVVVPTATLGANCTTNGPGGALLNETGLPFPQPSPVNELAWDGQNGTSVPNVVTVGITPRLSFDPDGTGPLAPVCCDGPEVKFSITVLPRLETPDFQVSPSTSQPCANNVGWVLSSTGVGVPMPNPLYSIPAFNPAGPIDGCYYELYYGATAAGLPYPANNALIQTVQAVTGQAISFQRVFIPGIYEVWQRCGVDGCYSLANTYNVSIDQAPTLIDKVLMACAVAPGGNNGDFEVPQYIVENLPVAAPVPANTIAYAALGTLVEIKGYYSTATGALNAIPGDLISLTAPFNHNSVDADIYVRIGQDGNNDGDTNDAPDNDPATADDCFFVAQIELQVKNRPVVNILATPVPECINGINGVGGVVTLTANVGSGSAPVDPNTGGPYIYLWTLDPDATLVSGSLGTAIPLVSGTPTITVISSTSGLKTFDVKVTDPNTNVGGANMSFPCETDASLNVLFLQPSFLNCSGSNIVLANAPGECRQYANFSALQTNLECTDLYDVRYYATGATVIGSAAAPVFHAQISGQWYNAGTTNITAVIYNASTGLPAAGIDPCTFDIIVEDREEPQALCRDFTVELNAAGTATVSALGSAGPPVVLPVDGGSTDNCAIVDRMLSQSSFTCANIGQNIITLTVMDAANNVGTCNATITVVDRIKPTITCPPAITISGCNSTTPNVLGGVTAAMVADNCTSDADLLASLTQNPLPGDALSSVGSPNGVSSIVLTVTDGQGNSQTCAMAVTITTQYTLALDVPEICLSVPANSTLIDFNNYVTVTNNNTGAVVSTATLNAAPFASNFSIASSNVTGGTAGAITTAGVYTPGTGTGFVTIRYTLTETQNGTDCSVYVEDVFELRQPLTITASACACQSGEREVNLTNIGGGLAPYTLVLTGASLTAAYNGTGATATIRLDAGQTSWSVTLIDARGCETTRSGSCAAFTEPPVFQNVQNAVCASDPDFTINVVHPASAGTQANTPANGTFVVTGPANAAQINMIFGANAATGTAAGSTIVVNPTPVLGSPAQAGVYTITFTYGQVGDVADNCRTQSISTQVTIYPSYNACFALPAPVLNGKICKTAAAFTLANDPLFINGPLFGQTVDQTSVWSMTDGSGNLYTTNGGPLGPFSAVTANGNTTFNPNFLQPGIYTINHAVGFDACQTECVATIEIKAPVNADIVPRTFCASISGNVGLSSMFTPTTTGGGSFEIVSAVDVNGVNVLANGQVALLGGGILQYDENGALDYTVVVRYLVGNPLCAVTTPTTDANDCYMTDEATLIITAGHSAFLDLPETIFCSMPTVCGPGTIIPVFPHVSIEDVTWLGLPIGNGPGQINFEIVAVNGSTAASAFLVDGNGDGDFTDVGIDFDYRSVIKVSGPNFTTTSPFIDLKNVPKEVLLTVRVTYNDPSPNPAGNCAAIAEDNIRVKPTGCATVASPSTSVCLSTAIINLADQVFVAGTTVVCGKFKVNCLGMPTIDPGYTDANGNGFFDPTDPNYPRYNLGALIASLPAGFTPEKLYITYMVGDATCGSDMKDAVINLCPAPTAFANFTANIGCTEGSPISLNTLAGVPAGGTGVWYGPFATAPASIAAAQLGTVVANPNSVNPLTLTTGQVFAYVVLSAPGCPCPSAMGLLTIGTISNGAGAETCQLFGNGATYGGAATFNLQPKYCSNDAALTKQLLRRVCPEEIVVGNKNVSACDVNTGSVTVPAPNVFANTTLTIPVAAAGTVYPNATINDDWFIQLAYFNQTDVSDAYDPLNPNNPANLSATGCDDQAINDAVANNDDLDGGDHAGFIFTGTGLAATDRYVVANNICPTPATGVTPRLFRSGQLPGGSYNPFTTPTLLVGGSTDCSPIVNNPGVGNNDYFILQYTACDIYAMYDDGIASNGDGKRDFIRLFFGNNCNAASEFSWTFGAMTQPEFTDLHMVMSGMRIYNYKEDVTRYSNALACGSTNTLPDGPADLGFTIDANCNGTIETGTAANLPSWLTPAKLANVFTVETVAGSAPGLNDCYDVFVNLNELIQPNCDDNCYTFEITHSIKKCVGGCPPPVGGDGLFTYARCISIDKKPNLVAAEPITSFYKLGCVDQKPTERVSDIVSAFGFTTDICNQSCTTCPASCSAGCFAAGNFNIPAPFNNYVINDGVNIIVLPTAIEALAGSSALAAYIAANPNYPTDRNAKRFYIPFTYTVKSACQTCPPEVVTRYLYVTRKPAITLPAISPGICPEDVTMIPIGADCLWPDCVFNITLTNASTSIILANTVANLNPQMICKLPYGPDRNIAPGVEVVNGFIKIDWDQVPGITEPLFGDFVLSVQVICGTREFNCSAEASRSYFFLGESVATLVDREISCEPNYDLTGMFLNLGLLPNGDINPLSTTPGGVFTILSGPVAGGPYPINVSGNSYQFCKMGTYSIRYTVGSTTACEESATANLTKSGPAILAPAASITVGCLQNNQDNVTLILDWLDNYTLLTSCNGSVNVTNDFLPTMINYCTGDDITVTWTATDACGNTATATRLLIVDQDITAPVFSVCPTNISVNNDIDKCSANVTWPIPAATDACSNTTITAAAGNPAQGSVFNVGTPTTISYTAMDACLNSSICSFTITVLDVQKPNALCKDITVDLSATPVSGGTVTVTAAMIDGGSTDNCPGLTRAGGATYTCNNLGNNDLVLTVTDASNNSSTCMARVIVRDVTKPTIVCPAAQNLVLNATCEAVIPSLVPTTLTDNCSVTYTQFPTAGTVVSALDNDQILVVLTAVDPSGNTSTCTTVLTVKDQTAPVITCPANLTLNNDVDKCSAVATWVDAVATDNCGATTLTRSGLAPGATVNVGAPQTVTYTATDLAGNTATCVFTVSVVDAQLPNALCKDITVDLSATPVSGGTVTVTAAMIDGGSTDNCPGLTRAGGATYTCNNLGNNDLVLTVTDASNNSSTCMARVIVRDVTKPTIVCPAAQNLVLNATCEAVIPSLVPTTLTDNCSVTYTQFPTAGTVVSALDNDQILVVLTAVDPSGNTSTCTTVLTVKDQTAPVITCPANLTLNNDVDKCSAVATWVDAVATDNCGATTLTRSGLAPGATVNVGAPQTVTYTATDLAGNTAVCSFTVSVLDMQAPNAVCKDITVVLAPYLCASGSLSGAQEVPANASTATGSYNIAYASGTSSLTVDLSFAGLTAPVTVAHIHNAAAGSNGPVVIDFVGAGFPVGSTSGTYSRTFTLTPLQETALLAGNLYFNIHSSAFPGGEIRGQITAPTACTAIVVNSADINGGSTDNCTGALSYRPGATIYGCSNVGDNNITLTVTDAAGNSSNCVSTVTVRDLTKPTITTCPASVTVNDCDDTVPAFTGLIATDNCALLEGFTQNPVAGTDFGQVSGNGITVTFTVTDASGNTQTCTATVTIIDNVNPTFTNCPQSFTVGNDVDKCGANVTFLAPSATDNCSGVTVVQTAGPTTGGFFPVGATAVSYRATDVNGNAATCSFVVTVTDMQTPTAICKDITVNLSATTNGGTVTVLGTQLDGGTYDNCPGTLTFVPVTSVFTCANVGDNNIQLTVTDAAGNTSTCNSTVTVRDVTAPVITNCPSNTTVSSCTSTVPNILTGLIVTDNCGVATVTQNPVAGTDFGQVNGNSVIVTITATDVNGNVSTCAVTVTINDTEKPVYVNCPTTMVMIGNDPDQCSGKLNWSIPVATDNCTLVSNLQVGGPAPGSVVAITCPGTAQTITYSATDANGNTAVCSFQVMVVDTEKPEFDADILMPGNVTVECDAVPTNCIPRTGGACTVLTNQDANDNCTAPANLVVTFNEVSTQGTNPALCSFYDYTLTRTWRVTDCAGNQLVHTQVITVRDRTAPIARCKPITVALDKAGIVTIIGADVNNASTDNCAAPQFLTLAVTPSTFRCANLGANVVTLTVTDPCGNSATCTATVTVTEGPAPCTPQYFVRTSCLDNATNDDNGQFEDVITIKSLAMQTWTVTANSTQNGQGLYTAANTLIAANTAFTSGTADGIDNDGDGATDEADEMIWYTLRGRFTECVGYTISVSNSNGIGNAVASTTASLSNKACYPNPYFTNLYDPFCVYTAPFQIGVAEYNNAVPTSIVITVNGVVTNTFNAATLGIGFHTIMATFDAGTATNTFSVNGTTQPGSGTMAQAIADPGCKQKITKIVEVKATPTAVVCNDLVYVSLDADCKDTLNADAVLEGTYFCFDDYKVELDRTGPNFANGPWAVAIIGVADINKTIGYRLVHSISGNICWGSIKVEDKLAPALTSPPNVTIACSESTAVSNTGNVGIADCQSTTTQISEAITDNGECGNPRLIIVRTFIVTDASGNQSTATQTITVKKFDLAEVVWPIDVTVNCENAYNNPNATKPASTGRPSINGAPIGVGGLCSASIGFWDERLEICAGSYEIYRTWKIANTCLPVSAGNPIEFVQRIRVRDLAGPQFACPPAVTVSVDPNSCCATAPLPSVIISEGCSNITDLKATVTGNDPNTGNIITFSVNGSLANFPGNNIWIPDTLATFPYTQCMPIGTYSVTYTAKDGCENLSVCQFEMKIEDLVPPSPVCDEFTQVGLGLDGMVFIDAISYDNGSLDNCGPVYFKAYRMDANPVQSNASAYDQVKFACEDIGDTVRVILRVYDVNPGAGTIALDAFEGRYSECMINTFVDDKIKPTCAAPANVTVSCEAFDPSLWAYGQPQTADNCSNPTVTGTLVLTQFDSLCNKGTITRRWTVVDAAGNSAVCSQRIVITYEQNYWVKFPADRIVTVCDGTSIFGAPEFYGEDCELLATSYVDEFFTVIPDACYKIERTWTVINWCKYDVNLPANNDLNVYVPNPNPNATTNHPTNLPGVTVSAPGTTVAGWVPTSVRINPTDPTATNYSIFWRKEANSYTYKQIVKVLDGQDPVVACPTTPTDYCDFSVNDAQFYNAMQYWDPLVGSHDLCEGDANIEITATDGCSGAAISFRYLLFLDLDANGTMETVINSVNPPGFNNINYNNANNANYAGGTPWQFDFRPVASDRKWGFGLQTDAPSGNNRTARVRWFNQANNPAAGAVPQLPYGTHKIKWFIEDGCGNETVCENTIVVKDCKKPTVVCINGLAVNLMNISGGMVQLWASDFLQYTEDNCTPAPQIKTAIRRKGVADGQGSVTGFPRNADGSPQTGVQFTCADLGTQLVELWGLDLAGNADFCETYVLIQDNAGVCTNTFATIAGALKTEEVEGVEDANVELDGSSNGVPMFDEVFTQQTGDYVFSNGLPYASNATVTPTLEIDPLNGVNTWDLILISRHILGLEPLNTPYKLISADANKSGTVTTFDIVELRKLILGTYPKLPANSSWRFVDKTQVFTNPANPFADVIRENIQIADIQQSINNGDFVGAKIGDVDNTATPNNLVASDDRTAGTLLFDVEERSVKAGEEFTVNFKAVEQVAGYQFTLNLSGLEVVNLVPGAKMSDENFAVFANAITTSADDVKGEFAVTFRATKGGKLSQMLSVSSRITRAVAFTGTEKMGVGLRFNNGGSTVITGQAFEVYQNTPNPWVSKTQIGFYLPSATAATLTVYDATGRTVYTATGDFGKGYNAFTIDRKVIATVGSLYYKVETTTDSGVKQMIQMK